MKAGRDAVAVEPSVYHKAGSLGDDDDACMCVHEVDFMVVSRIDVFQDGKAISEHKVDINVISIAGPGQGTEVKIVKRVLSRSPAGFTLKRNPKHARDLIAWAVLEQSKAAAPSPCTAATTKTMRNALDELLWERAKAASSAGGTATYLKMDRPDTPHLHHPQSKSRLCKTESANRSEAGTSCSVLAGWARAHLDISVSREFDWSRQ